jgi:hypothetical protein
MTNEQAIDAFVDGETIDTSALDAALASPEGRAYLFDALALRRLAQTALVDTASHAPATRPSVLPFYARAAVVALGLLGLGYAAGVRGREMSDVEAPTATAQAEPAPEPTRIIQLKPGINWHETKGGD